MRRGRRLLASLNLLTVLLLLGVLFIMVNYLASRRFARWDLTQQRVTALSDQTRQVLQALTEPLSIIVFYQPDHRLYELIKDQLTEYQRLSPQLSVEFIDPDQDIARAKQLAQQFQIEDLNLVVFQAGTRHKYLSDSELADYDFTSMGMGGEPRVSAFKGEDAFTSAIISVTQAEAPTVWFTSGHGEKTPEGTGRESLSALKRALEQQNISPKTVTLLEQPAIPPEVKLLVIPGPSRRFTEGELALLQTYAAGGGKLLALIDPFDDTGLDGLLERWGITVGLNVVVDPANRLPFVSASNLLVTTYTDHPIVQKMQTFVTLFPLARSVEPNPSNPEGMNATRLALTSEEGWGETQPSGEAFEFTGGQDLKGPVCIAVASERLPASPTDGAQAGETPARTRVVAIGDSDFIGDAQLGNVGNRDLILGAIRWLIEQEQLIGISPKAIESIKLNLTDGQLTSLFWISFLGLPMGCALLGLGVWLLRRQ
jgi:ABC-type uncharacterized transport system involved in gliding motility auxiliary subunit